MEKIKLEIISPEGIVISCDCMFISLPSTEGIIEIRFGHEPIVIQLREGNIQYDSAEPMHIHAGFATVTGSLCKILLI